MNLTKLAFFPMKILVSKDASFVKNMYFSIGKIDMSMSFKLQCIVFVLADNNKGVYNHEKTADLQ